MIANYAKGSYGGCSNQQIYDEKFISKEENISVWDTWILKK